MAIRWDVRGECPPATRPAARAFHERIQSAMYQPIRHSRRAGRAFLAAFATLSLAACEGSDDILPPPQHRAAALQVISRNPQPGVAGQPLPEKLRVRVVDEAGNGVQGVNVAFYVSEGGGTIFASVPHQLLY